VYCILNRLTSPRHPIGKANAALKANHEADHAAIFDRVSLELGQSGALDDLPPDELHKGYGNTEKRF